MDLKILLLLIILAVFVYFLYREMCCVNYNSDVIKNYIKDSNNTIKKELSTQLENQFNKIKSANADSINSARKIGIINKQPLVPQNHYTDNGDTGSDAIGSGTQVSGTTYNKSDDDLYMSYDKKSINAPLTKDENNVDKNDEKIVVPEKLDIVTPETEKKVSEVIENIVPVKNKTEQEKPNNNDNENYDENDSESEKTTESSKSINTLEIVKINKETFGSIGSYTLENLRRVAKELNISDQVTMSTGKTKALTKKQLYDKIKQAL